MLYARNVERLEPFLQVLLSLLTVLYLDLDPDFCDLDPIRFDLELVYPAENDA